MLIEDGLQLQIQFCDPLIFTTGEVNSFINWNIWNDFQQSSPTAVFVQVHVHVFVYCVFQNRILSLKFTDLQITYMRSKPQESSLIKKTQQTRKWKHCQHNPNHLSPFFNPSKSNRYPALVHRCLVTCFLPGIHVWVKCPQRKGWN